MQKKEKWKWKQKQKWVVEGVWNLSRLQLSWQSGGLQCVSYPQVGGSNPPNRNLILHLKSYSPPQFIYSHFVSRLIYQTTFIFLILIQPKVNISFLLSNTNRYNSGLLFQLRPNATVKNNPTIRYLKRLRLLITNCNW